MKKLNLASLFVTLLLMLTLVYGAEAQRKYTVFVNFKNGEKVTGKLIRVSRDSLSLLNAQNSKLLQMGVAEIKSIRIRKKGSIGIGFGIGAGVGAIIGGIVGIATYKKQDCSGSVFCDAFEPLDEAYTAVGSAAVGAVTGSLLGGAIGSAGRVFEIEGNQGQFDVFANEFK